MLATAIRAAHYHARNIPSGGAPDSVSMILRPHITQGSLSTKYFSVAGLLDSASSALSTTKPSSSDHSMLGSLFKRLRTSKSRLSDSKQAQDVSCFECLYLLVTLSQILTMPFTSSSLHPIRNQPATPNQTDTVFSSSARRKLLKLGRRDMMSI